ncbi:NFACT family protein [Candidatus Woesearchaeota archaeon]|nr:NFACT family protein [Candidatus Woesearchaeota archaeon]
MRNQIAAIELRTLVSELKQLEGSWLDQVYELQQPAAAKPGKSIVLQLNTSEGKRFLVCLAPSSLFFSSKKPATAEKPGGFCSFLRHHLGNARLASVLQPGSERILELVFSSRQQLHFRLIIELFSKGNVILVDEKGVILGCAEHQAWRDRTVRPGFAYALPPATADFAAMNEGQFQKAVLSSEKDSVVKALAVDLGLSGTYAEQLCSAAAVDKSKKPSKLSQLELQKLYSSLQQLLSRKQPINATLEANATAQLTAASVSPKTAAFSMRINELEIAIGQQNSAVAEFARVAEEATKAAKLIYEHYQDVKRILDDYNTLRKTFTPDQLREYFGSNKLIRSIDEKTGQITLEINGNSQ